MKKFSLDNDLIDEVIYCVNYLRTFDFTTDSQITDNQPVLTLEQVDILKNINLCNMEFGKPYKKDPTSAFMDDVFDIFDTHNHDLKVTLSNRIPSNRELRGDFFKRPTYRSAN